MKRLINLVKKLNSTTKNDLENAVAEAMKRRSPTVELDHWLFHIICGKDVRLQSFLEAQCVDLATLQSDFEANMGSGINDPNSRPTISGDILRTLELAWVRASVDMSVSVITSDILLLTALEPSAVAGRPLPTETLNGVNLNALRQFATSRAEGLPSQVRPSKGDRQLQDNSALARFTLDLTEQARNGQLDKVMGRTSEVSKILDILLRRRQNNPILLGEPGVGKTAVVEGFAQKIISGEVPDNLKNAKLLSLDMGLLQAGASVKGEFEERLKNVIEEVKSSETPIIVFIDEAHTMIGAGGSEGQNDAANLLKPALARGELRTIGATTFAEYKKYFEKDPALARRFQPITVNEPSAEVCVNILRAVANGLSVHHQVLITDSAIRAAVDLSIRYMPARKLPDKAISLLDTASARVAVSQHARPEMIEFLEERIRFAELGLSRLNAEKEAMGNNGAIAQQMEEERATYQIQYDDAVARWGAEKHKLRDAKDTDSIFSLDPEASREFVHPWVNHETVAAIISEWTGVPVGDMGASDAERLMHLSDVLKERVFGQSQATDAIARALKVSRAGLSDSRKPIGAFLMCGPSGVGKTETALAIAEQLFGDENALLTINMTEFKEAHKTSMLLGASAGYVGYGKGGVLTEAVRLNPYRVILLDEIEKAHPAIHDVFFQILDKGSIHDSEGIKVDFRNTIIIMTSNAGGEEIRDFINSHDKNPSNEEIISNLKNHLLNFFSPAFLGRTEVIAYKPLDNETSAKIVKMHLSRLGARLRDQYGASLNIGEALVDYIVSANNDPFSGGRALETIINRELTPLIADSCIEKLLAAEVITEVRIDYIDGDISIDVL